MDDSSKTQAISSWMLELRRNTGNLSLCKIIHTQKPVRSGHVCVKMMHCTYFVMEFLIKFKWSKSNKSIFNICYETEMPKNCLRSRGKVLWLPLHGMILILLLPVLLHSVLVRQVLKRVQPLYSQFSRDERDAFLMF